ncbi:MAG: hypothetical protein PHO03_06310 [Candidatus Omnitrophica bacterium]|nr:hypothetical protein [Candidatus Omnitrophota bacterium]
MKLTILERLVLGAILPQKNNYTTMIAVQEIKDKIAITIEEIEEYQIVFEDLQTRWSKEGENYEIDVEFGKTLSVIINEALQEKNKTNELTLEMLSLYEKFVTDQQPNPEA